jgi:DNA repair ATPase RecN
LAVSRATHPLTMSMDNFIQGTSREQVDGIQRIVNRFMQQMDAAMNGQFNALAEAMERMNKSLSEVQQGLNYTIDTAKELAMDKQKADPVTKDRKDLEKLLRQNEETMAKLTQSLDSIRVPFENVMGKADNKYRLKAENELGAKLDALTETMDRLGEAINRLPLYLGVQDGELPGAEHSGGQQA